MGRGLDGLILRFIGKLCSFEGPRAMRAAGGLAAGVGLEQFPVAIAWGKHLFPFRTEQLSPTAPMVLGSQGPGRVGRRRFLLRAAFGRLVCVNAPRCVRERRTPVPRPVCAYESGVLPAEHTAHGATAARSRRRAAKPAGTARDPRGPRRAVAVGATNMPRLGWHHVARPAEGAKFKRLATPSSPRAPNSTRAARSCGGPRGVGSPSGAPVLPERGAVRLRSAPAPAVRPASCRPVRGGGPCRSCAHVADDRAGGGAGARRWGRWTARSVRAPAGEPVPAVPRGRGLPLPASRTRVPCRRPLAPARGASDCLAGVSSAWGTCVREGTEAVGRNGRRRSPAATADLALQRGKPALDSASGLAMHRRPGSRRPASALGPRIQSLHMHPPRAD